MASPIEIGRRVYQRVRELQAERKAFDSQKGRQYDPFSNGVYVSSPMGGLGLMDSYMSKKPLDVSGLQQVTAGFQPNPPRSPYSEFYQFLVIGTHALSIHEDIWCIAAVAGEKEILSQGTENARGLIVFNQFRNKNGKQILFKRPRDEHDLMPVTIRFERGSKPKLYSFEPRSVSETPAAIPDNEYMIAGDGIPSRIVREFRTDKGLRVEVTSR